MAKVSNQELIEKLTARFNDQLSSVTEPFGLLTFETKREDITEVLSYLKNELQFIHLTDITAVHYPELETPFAVVYHLHNLAENKRIRIKTFVTLGEPAVSTVTDLFSSANWMERETYDFYGILFEGHPNLKRILNVEYMDFFPMRKEYPLEDPTREDKDDRYFGR